MNMNMNWEEMWQKCAMTPVDSRFSAIAQSFQKIIRASEKASHIKWETTRHSTEKSI